MVIGRFVSVCPCFVSQCGIVSFCIFFPLCARRRQRRRRRQQEDTQQWMTVRLQHQPRQRRQFLHSIFSAATTRLSNSTSSHIPSGPTALQHFRLGIQHLSFSLLLVWSAQGWRFSDTSLFYFFLRSNALPFSMYISPIPYFFSPPLIFLSKPTRR